jgi:hypothetical protein
MLKVLLSQFGLESAAEELWDVCLESTEGLLGWRADVLDRARTLDALLSCVGFGWYEWRAMGRRKAGVCGVRVVGVMLMGGAVGWLWEQVCR